MVKSVRTILFILLIVSICQLTTVPQSRQKPEPPPLTVPKIDLESTIVVCIDCERRAPSGRSAGGAGLSRRKGFDPATHKKLEQIKLIKTEYIDQLRWALYAQDYYHQFQSKAHFDNCDFDGSMDYINELIKETDQVMELAQKYNKSGDVPKADNMVKQAFFSLGQILHGLQDFYAHSNYVELMRKEIKDFSEVTIIPLWVRDGRSKIKDLRDKGLVSGYVYWGLPQKCDRDVLSHRDLAKDTIKTKAGKIIVGEWGNITQYEAAFRLAQTASYEFVMYAFDRWPLLKEKGGNYVAYEVFQERRGI
jgi:hypothetical protein